MVSNDYPERYYNTGTSQLGTFTHRWRHSCKYEDCWTPSYRECDLNRIETVLSGSDGKKMLSCNKQSGTECSDWWSPERKNVYTNTEVYPISPGELVNDLGPYPSVELSFDMMEASMGVLQDWYQKSNTNSLSKKEKKELLKTADSFLQRVGVSS